MNNRAEVREFLISRRAKITPEQAGLPAGTNRRVPGLRRTEVAALAGVSIEYYSIGLQVIIDRPSGPGGRSPVANHFPSATLRYEQQPVPHPPRISGSAEISASIEQTLSDSP